eukprot:2632050-Rhodomonas_salina.2
MHKRTALVQAVRQSCGFVFDFAVEFEHGLGIASSYGSAVLCAVLSTARVRVSDDRQRDSHQVR